MSADEDDFADRDEEPRADVGRFDSEAPRLRRRPSGAPTRWTFVEVDAKPSDAPVGGAIGGTLRCKLTTASNPGCGELAVVLHADPRSSSPERVVCGGCAGRVLRERIGWAQASEPKETHR